MSTVKHLLRYPFGFILLCLLSLSQTGRSQAPHEPGDPVQAPWIYDPANNLDIDLDGYTLVEGKTFSFRENPDGSKTDTYFDMTKTSTWNSSAYTQGYLFRDLAQFSTYMNYRLHFPSGYDPNYAAGYPMIVLMHGAGERGNCWGKKCFWSSQDWRPNTNTPAAPTNAQLIDKNDSGPKLMSNDLNLANGGQAHDAAIARAKGMYPDNPALPSNAWPGFFLVPQNLNGWANADPQDAIRIIRLLLKKYPIDPNRIVVHGLSDGGFGVYEIIKRAPEVTVLQHACIGLVDMIERNAPRDELRHAIQEHVSAFRAESDGRRLDAVMLGCTHYPLVADLFAAALPPGIDILSQPDLVARSLAAYLTRRPEIDTLEKSRSVRFLTSGAAAEASRFASIYFGRPAVFNAAELPSD